MRATILGFALIAMSACGRVPLDGVLGAAGGATGSGGATGLGGMTGAGGASARVPSQHRATPVCPPIVRQEGSTSCFAAAGSPETSVCALDSDCLAKPGGRCGMPVIDGGSCGCIYDDCTSDADCGDEVCACSDLSYVGNRCVPGTCHVDADCGPDGFCGPIEPLCVRTGITGYQCHTAKDACLVDSDCTGASECWATDTSGWTCIPIPLCPNE
ncbi:MAG TPA: hypothetical protein VHJ20_08210 [Polyangia bacterium]|nr:hypothetical protein [Polyangia bacterium]